MSKEMKKDANGRLPAECYAPECIGYNMGYMFGKVGLLKEQGLDILRTILDLPVSEFIADDAKVVAGVQAQADALVEVFTIEGATLDEVRAAAQYTLDKAQSPEMETLMQNLQALTGGGSDGETLH